MTIREFLGLLQTGKEKMQRAAVLASQAVREIVSAVEYMDHIESQLMPTDPSADPDVQATSPVVYPQSPSNYHDVRTSYESLPEVAKDPDVPF